MKEVIKGSKIWISKEILKRYEGDVLIDGFGKVRHLYEKTVDGTHYLIRKSDNSKVLTDRRLKYPDKESWLLHNPMKKPRLVPRKGNDNSLGVCRRTGKIPYLSKVLALLSLSEIQVKDETYRDGKWAAYRCDCCKFWHIGHKR